MDIGALVNEYQSQGLPVSPEGQLREEAAADARKCLETMMICEARGHLWKEKDADPENGDNRPGRFLAATAIERVCLRGGTMSCQTTRSV